MWSILLTSLAHAAPAPWAEAMATGDCASVLSALPSPTSPPERLAVARCAARTGDAARAEQLAGAIDGELAPYAAAVRADALLSLGRGPEAVTALAGVSLPGDDEEIQRARALLAAGRPADAVAILRVLVGEAAGSDGKTRTSRRADEAWWWLAQAREVGGDAPNAVAALRRLWSEHPGSARATDAETHLAGLHAPVPDASTADGRALMLRRARTLLKLSLADQAIPLLDALDQTTPFATAAEQRFMADALFAARQYARARDWYGRCGAATTDPKGAFSEALATARAGDYPGAAEKYKAIVRRWPTASEADEASWKPAYMDYDAGRYPEAIAGFTAYLAARPTGRFASDARWFRAWSHEKLGEKDAALAGFAEVLAKDGSTDLASAARYWQAKEKGDTAALTALAKSRSAGGYAWYVATAQDIHFPVPAEVPPGVLPATFVSAHPHTRTALLLLDAGLPDLARPLLEGDIVAAKAAGEATAIPMAEALVRAESYRAAQELAGPWCAKAAARAACYPRPYVGTVTRLATEAGLDPLLPYAIMNAESGLDPSVTSPAGARGLMQLMPALATGLADGKVPGFVIDDLYRAGINARLGTLELVSLQARLGTSPIQPSLPLVIAGYNGGADAVDRWAQAAPTGTGVDRFAEDISFTETRRYVRRVLGYLMRYKSVYGG